MTSHFCRIAGMAAAVSVMHFASAVALFAEPSSFSDPKTASQGIWKSYVPRGIAGEFGGNDPMGLIAGQLIPADCSLNWRAQDGKLYCFSSGTSLVYFLNFPNTNLKKAGEAWQKLCQLPPPKSVIETPTQ